MAYMKTVFCLRLSALFLLLSIARSQTLTWAPTAPDVVVSVMKTTVNIAANLAQTTVEIHLKNPSSRTGEGQLVFPLPQGVSVNRYALDINGAFREAVPVDKNKGTQVFEALETVRVDPGLLQKADDGNSFKTRVFPIPPGGVRKVLIGYQQQLDLNDKNQFFYRMVSSYARSIETFSLSINVVSDSKPQLIDDDTGESFPTTKSKSGFSYSVQISNGVPKKSISVHIPQVQAKAQPITKYANGKQYFYTFVRPAIPASASASDAGSSIAIVWDTSLSCKGRNSAKEFQLLDSYFSGRDVAVELYFIGYYFWMPKTFKVAGGNWAALKTFLDQARYDGGSKLSEIRLSKAFDEVLLFSDGVSTLGKASELSFASGQVVHCINSLPTASHDFLNYLAIRQSGNYVDLTSLSAADAARLLKGDVTRFQGIEDNAAIDRVYPEAGTPVSQNIFSIVGRASSLPQTVVLKFGPSASNITSRVSVVVSENPNEDISADKLWAQKAIASLEYNYDENKDEINGLGIRYNIVTKGTSLIVLENLSDYIRFGIVPPPGDLRTQYDDRQKQAQTDLEQAKQSGASKLDTYWSQLSSWWSSPKSTPVVVSPPPISFPLISPQPRRPPLQRPVSNFVTSSSAAFPDSTALSVDSIALNQAGDGVGIGGASFFGSGGAAVAGGRATGLGGAGLGGAGVAPPTAPRVSNVAMAKSAVVADSAPSFNAAPSHTAPTSASTIPPAADTSAPSTSATTTSGVTSSSSSSKEFSIGKSYMASIKGASGQSNQYAAYLAQREANRDNPTFYIDVAEFLYPINGTLALQVLSSIADLSLENAFLYKTLSYYFKQFKAYPDCLYALKKVNDWRPFEPQSHRDLALAYELNGDIKAAAEELSQVINTTFYGDVANKVDGFQDTILMDVNRIAEQSGSQYFSGKFADKFLKPLPVDIRIVMTWNQPSVDLDLRVTDPTGEECYYGHKRTAIGGRIGKDFTTGLGPEMFLLKNATKGEYLIKSNYYGETKLTNSGPTTVNVEVYLRSKSGKVSSSYKTIQMVNVKQDGYLGTITV